MFTKQKFEYKYISNKGMMGVPRSWLLATRSQVALFVKKNQYKGSSMIFPNI
jgi:hypothetical protein